MRLTLANDEPRWQTGAGRRLASHDREELHKTGFVGKHVNFEVFRTHNNVGDPENSIALVTTPNDGFHSFPVNAGAANNWFRGVVVSNGGKERASSEKLGVFVVPC